MKKSLLIGAATLAVTVMVGAGFGSASSQDVKEESAFAVKTTSAVKATAEEMAAFEGESTPAVKTTPARKATAEEIAAFEVKATAEEKEMAAFEGESTPAVKTTPARKATAEEIAAFEAEAELSSSSVEPTSSAEAVKK